MAQKQFNGARSIMRSLKFRVWSKDQKTYDYNLPYNSIGDFYVSTGGKVFSDFGNIHEPPKDFRPEHLKCMGVSISKGGEE